MRGRLPEESILSTLDDGVHAPVKAARPAARQIAWLPRESIASAPHEAFALAFRPGERFFHRLALRVAQHHLGQRRLRVDLLRDLRRGRRGRN
jgi:hypothetical protein